jgi:hypothetical protein
MGLVRSTGTVVDPLTHKSVYRYEATGDSPKPVVKKKHKKLTAEEIFRLSALYNRAYTQGYYDALKGIKFPDMEVEA